jgi:hypothetical protein
MEARGEKMTKLGLLLGSTLLFAAVGCGGAGPKPTGQLVAAEAAIRGAEEAGAQDEPQAALHLKMARDQIAEAQVLIANENNNKAGDALVRAKVDAELAIVLTRSATQEADARQVIRQVEELQSESGPAAEGGE